VTCTVKKTKSAKKVSVSCKVTLPKTTAKASHVTWRLTRAGRAVTHGTTRSNSRLTLHLRKGRYALYLTGAPKATTIVVR
jgi:hypothetical protein